MKSQKKKKILWFFQVGATFLWWNGLSVDEISDQLQLTWTFVDKWSRKCNNLAVHLAMCGSQPIGGPGVSVEFHQIRFDKSKAACLELMNNLINIFYWNSAEKNRIFGGLESETGRSFLIPIPDGKVKTISSAIQNYIRPGSIVLTDTDHYFLA